MAKGGDQFAGCVRLGERPFDFGQLFQILGAGANLLREQVLVQRHGRLPHHRLVNAPLHFAKQPLIGPRDANGAQPMFVGKKRQPCDAGNLHGRITRPRLLGEVGVCGHIAKQLGFVGALDNPLHNGTNGVDNI